jgi:anti-anti-sigma factor
MPVKIEEYGKICVIEVEGDFNGETARLALTALEQKTEQRRIVDFVIDMARCGFMDSEGLEALVGMKRRCEDLFGQVKLARLDENCKTILRLTRLESRFETHDELEAALKNMR